MREAAILIIGSGLAGLTAAITVAQQGKTCILVSSQASERAQSVLAEGGINAALNTKGQGDSVQQHFEDTMKGGAFLADPNAVWGLTSHAPELVNWLWGLGVPFAQTDRQIDLRSFGGQKKQRTAYAKSSTGKMIMTALIDAVRKYEAAGLVTRLAHHEFVDLLTETQGDTIQSIGCRVLDTYSGTVQSFYGPVILATGGLTGFFAGATTGSTQNTGAAAATVFRQGVAFGNLEMIQYHPTTVQVPGKRMLVSEAARGEGGRLFVYRNGKPWYFMEELCPELGNLATRDVISREMVKVVELPGCEKQVYLDLTGLSEKIWKEKLSDMRSELLHYLSIDPAHTPVPVKPGIHYFMGGILVDEQHRTNLPGLYAAGECTCQYHGANRLGGNSMLGAIYGGKVAAETALRAPMPLPQTSEGSTGTTAEPETPSPALQAHLLEALGICREEARLQIAIDALEAARDSAPNSLALAMLYSARARTESRGAHWRTDYPQQQEAFRKTTVAEYHEGSIQITFQDIPAFREEGGAFHGKEA